MTENTQRSLIIAALVLVAVAVLYVIGPGGGNGEPQQASPSPGGDMVKFVANDPRPTVPDVSFQDANGQKIDLNAYRDKVVLINFWATWCAPCVKELPSLARLDKAIDRDDFAVLAVNLDRNQVKAKEWFAVQKIPELAFYADPSLKMQQAFEANALPTTVLIDRVGGEIGRLLGEAEWDAQDAREMIEELLAQTP